MLYLFSLLKRTSVPNDNGIITYIIHICMHLWGVACVYTYILYLYRTRKDVSWVSILKKEGSWILVGRVLTEELLEKLKEYGGTDRALKSEGTFIWNTP